MIIYGKKIVSNSQLKSNSQKDDDYRSARQKKINRKVSAKDLLRQFLVTERGLPDV